MRVNTVPLWLRVSVVMLIGASLVAVWRWHPGTAHVQSFAAWFSTHRHEWYALPIVMSTFIALGLIMVPVMLLIAATGIAFGPFLGPVYAMAGCLASGSVGFVIGRLIGLQRVHDVGGQKIARVTGALKRNGTLAVFIARKVPAPFTLINIVIGASTVRYGDFIIGTLLGMGASVIGVAGFGYQLREALRDPAPAALAKAAMFVAIPLMLALLINHSLQRLRTASPERSRGAA